MNNTLADLDVLVLKCRPGRSREYISESIQCYKAGAYRATIVNVWIAVVFDLVDKIRDLTLSGDGAAKEINTRFEGYIVQINKGNDQGVKNALEFERTIIATCGKELSFFDHQQMRDLQRLREDRHQCAHPSFQSAGIPHRPTAELARLHLRNAVEHVLSQPPVQGKAAIVELLTIISSDYFPKDHQQAEKALLDTSLAKPSGALIRGLIDSLVLGFANPESLVYKKIQVSAVLSVLLTFHRNEASPRISKQLSALIMRVEDSVLPDVVGLISALPELAELANNAAQTRLKEFILQGPEDDVSLVLTIAKSPILKDEVTQRIQRLDIDHLAIAIQHKYLWDLLKPKVLRLLSKSGSWDKTNRLIDKLLIPIFEALTPDDIREIIKMPKENGADLVGAHSYSSFIRQVDNADKIPRSELEELLKDNYAENMLCILKQND